MLVKNYEQFQIINELDLNKNTVSQWMGFVRQVMGKGLFSSSEQMEAFDRLSKSVNPNLVRENIIRNIAWKDSGCS